MSDEDFNMENFFKLHNIKKTLIVKSLDGEPIDEDVYIDILASWQDGTFTFHRDVFNSTYSLYWELDQIANPESTNFMEAYPRTDDELECLWVDIDPDNSNLDRNFTWSDLRNNGPVDIDFGWKEISGDGGKGE